MTNRILIGDCRDVLREIPDESVHCVVTSPPYFGLRDYGVDGQMGLEPTLAEYIDGMVAVFREVRRVLRSDGTCWINIGDSYAANRSYQVTDNKHRDVGNNGSMRVPDGLKAKDLMMVPARLALALQADGWWLRSDIIWSKPNPMPESVTDRPTSAHEHIFLLTKSKTYFYDADAVRTALSPSSLDRSQYDHSFLPAGATAETYGVKKLTGNMSPGARTLGVKTDKQRGHSRRHDGFNDRWDAMSKDEQQAGGANLRNVWTVSTGAGFRGGHFAVYPPELVERCIKAGCPVGGTVLDPFGGSGTTGLVADRLDRDSILIELNPEYAELAQNRIKNDAPMFATVEVA